MGVTNLEGDRDIFEIMGLDRERLGVGYLKRERGRERERLVG